MESKAEQRLNKGDSSVGLLQTLESSLGDIRNLITCRVCIRPLFEPYTLQCGHTFCYGCLLRWFERDRTKKSCPDCRAEVLRAPAPAYLVRDMTQIFANRAELLPQGETTEDHRNWQIEEAAAVEKDRSSTGRRGGLFRGCFKAYLGRPPFVDHVRQPAIRDVEDGVDRCPRCTWELEDGVCQSCGYPSESEDLSDSDSLEQFPHDYLYDDGAHGDVYGDSESAVIDDRLDGANMPPGFGREYSPASSSELSYSSGYVSLGRHHDMPPEDELRLAISRSEARLRPMPDGIFQDEETPDDSMQEGSGEVSEDDEEVGSLDGFVVNDMEEHTLSPPPSVGRVHWSSEGDSETDPTENQPSGFSEREDGSQRDDEPDADGAFSTLSPTIQSSLDDETDGGPLPPSRRRIARRLATSNASSDDEISVAIGADRRGRRGNNVPSNTADNADAQRNMPHSSRDGHARGRSNGVPIQIDSDSDAPIPASRPARRGRVQLPRRSEDAAAEASSGTLGRPSPETMPSTHQSRRSNAQPSTQPLPIVLDSSPRRAATDDSQENRSDVIRPSSLHPFLPEHRPQDNSSYQNRASASTNDEARGSGPSSTQPSHVSPFSLVNRLTSPVPYRSQRIPASGSPRPTTAREEFDEGVRQRQARKAERKIERRRMKAERDRKRAGDAVRLASSSG